MFLDDQERKRRIADMVYAVNLAVHGDQEAHDLYRQRLRREL